MNDLIIFDADVRGLPPKRAALAKLVSQRKRESEALAKLEAGKAKLAARIEKAEAAQHRDAAEVDAAAASIVQQVLRGLDWTIAAVKKRSPVLPELAVERQALVQLKAAIEFKQAETEDLDRLISEAVKAALVEHAAATIAAQYLADIENVRLSMIRLEGLESALGRARPGRLVGEMPGFPTAGHDLQMTAIAAPANEVVAAAECWRSLGREWLEHPRAHPGTVMRFGKHDPAALADVPYHELSSAERQIVDPRFAAN